MPDGKPDSIEETPTLGEAPSIAAVQVLRIQRNSAAHSTIRTRRAFFFCKQSAVCWCA